MGKKLGKLIKEARTDAGYTQEQLARKVKTLSASDISRIERGEKEPTQDQVKEIARVTGVTQKSLLEAMSKKKPASSTTAGSKPASTTGTSMRVTATERRLVELYRKADSKKKKAVMDMLRGNDVSAGSLVSTLLEGATSLLTGKRELESEDEE